jgi:ATP-binding protein involved in chromosome partitioning
VPFLGEIPLDPKIRVSGDEGRPLMVADPQAPQAEAFRRVAKSLVEAIANAPAPGAHAHSHPH